MNDVALQFFSFSYAEGVYFDLWMITHFLSGVVIGFCVLLFTQWKQTLAYIISVLLLSLWELAEILLNIEEVLINRIIDIVVGAIGFALVYVWMRGKDRSVVVTSFAVAILALVVSTALGWIAYYKRVV